MTDKPAFAGTAAYFAERARTARDPADRTRLLEAASFYRSFAQAANASVIHDPNIGATELRRCKEQPPVSRMGRKSKRYSASRKTMVASPSGPNSRRRLAGDCARCIRRGLDFGGWRSLH